MSEICCVVSVRKSSVKQTVVHKAVENVVAESGKTSDGHGRCKTVYFCVNSCC